ncbi:hypothetical protein OBCHQ24_04815 [Oceanobacillus iheyensis]|nr:hypothetical protein OBCHQ24_04815 [Oceanobacillus iheyensis]
MIEILNVVIEGIRDLFKDNYLDLVFYLSTLLMFFYLFKHFKNSLKESDDSKKEQVQKQLIVLTNLEFELEEYKRSGANFELLKEKLINATPYISYELNRDVRNIRPNMDANAINDFLKVLRVEIDGCKYIQIDDTSHVNEKSIVRIIDYHYKSKFGPILFPLLLTLGAMVMLSVFLLITIPISLVDSFGQKFILSYQAMNPIICVAFILTIIDLIANKKVQNKWTTWISIVTAFALSISSIVLAHKHVIWSISLAILFILELFFVLPKILKGGTRK